MFRPAILLCAVAGLLLSLSGQRAAACDGHAHAGDAQIKKITVSELASALEAKQALTVYDVNSDETRGKYGVIPGAKLLSHYANFDPAKELPAAKDAMLVFYCGSKKCSAAPKAAEKAAGAGYTNVYVLEAGIKGWIEAGKAVRKPAA